ICTTTASKSSYTAENRTGYARRIKDKTVKLSKAVVFRSLQIDNIFQILLICLLIKRQKFQKLFLLLNLLLLQLMLSSLIDRHLIKISVNKMISAFFFFLN